MVERRNKRGGGEEEEEEEEEGTVPGRRSRQNSGKDGGINY